MLLIVKCDNAQGKSTCKCSFLVNLFIILYNSLHCHRVLCYLFYSHVFCTLCKYPHLTEYFIKQTQCRKIIFSYCFDIKLSNNENLNEKI